MKNVLMETRLVVSRHSSVDAIPKPGSCQTTTTGVTRRTALLGLAGGFSIGRATLAMASAPPWEANGLRELGGFTAYIRR
jgi:hypothetical protein